MRSVRHAAGRRRRTTTTTAAVAAPIGRRAESPWPRHCRPVGVTAWSRGRDQRARGNAVRFTAAGGGVYTCTVCVLYVIIRGGRRDRLSASRRRRRRRRRGGQRACARTRTRADPTGRDGRDSVRRQPSCLGVTAFRVSRALPQGRPALLAVALCLPVCVCVCSVCVCTTSPRIIIATIIIACYRSRSGRSTYNISVQLSPVSLLL